jgi:cobalt-zinc-cadmium resistance protein CzcA
MKKYPGINFNYSQPIIDNVAEAVAGMNANNAVKIFGPDLRVLDSLSSLVLANIRNVTGVKDAGILRNIGQPEIQIHLDNEKMAVYGVAMQDAQNIVEMAVGGTTITEKFEGESRFDIRLRYPKETRHSEEEILKLMVPTFNGSMVPLGEFATIQKVTGPAFVYRDNNKRFIGVKFSVRERDLGSTISEAQKNVESKVKLPKGYTIVWTGEFENQVRASGTLSQVVPISILAIFVLLFILFGNAKDAGLVLLNVPFALIGGILALHVTGMNFGISAGVGFIALFGICVQNGVILISVFKNNQKEKMPLKDSIIDGVKSRIRPVVMTALMAAIGLLPAAMSTGIGSESQKPLAIVIIGGLITATILTLLIFPNIYYWANLRMYNKKLNANKTIES